MQDLIKKLKIIGDDVFADQRNYVKQNDLQKAANDGRMSLIDGNLIARWETDLSDIEEWQTYQRCRTVIVRACDDYIKLIVRVHDGAYDGSPTSRRWSAAFRINDLSLIELFRDEIDREWRLYLLEAWEARERKTREAWMSELEKTLLN